MSHLSKMSIPIFLHHFLVTSKCFILMLTPLQLDNWLQSYEELVNAKKQYKTKEIEHCFCQYLKINISDIRLIPLDHVTIYYDNNQRVIRSFNEKNLVERLCHTWPDRPYVYRRLHNILSGGKITSPAENLRLTGMGQYLHFEHRLTRTYLVDNKGNKKDNTNIDK